MDEDIAKYLPEMAGRRLESGEAVSVKIRHLLTHTSGLRDTPLEGVRTLQQAVSVYAAQTVAFVPGTRWKYSQAGYNTASRIVEVVSGQPFDAFVQRRIFDPLGMKRSTFRRDGAWGAALATGYGRDQEGGALVPVPPHPDYGMPTWPPFGNGGVYSTAPDYARFCQMLLGGGVFAGKRFLSNDSVRLLTTVQTGDLPSGFFQRTEQGGFGANYGWGLGCGVLKVPHVRATLMLSPGSYGHGGAWGTQAWMDPVRGVGYILMIQRSGLPNAEGSEVRCEFQEAASRALRK